MSARKVCDVAMFLGAALNHPVPPCNGGGVVSTIFVDQYKSKFSEVRIYCTLAHPNLVERFWRSSGREGPPSESFVADCLKWDARHYRACHFSMLSLLGENEWSECVLASASHNELLLRSVEELNSLLESWGAKTQEIICDKWKVKDVDELRAFLKDISGFGERIIDF